MSNTLVDPNDLRLFPGAPFLPEWVDIAAADVRAEAGWHIAPVLTETITLYGGGWRDLVMPSRRVTAVTAVTSDSGPLTGWRILPGSVLWLPSGWRQMAYQVTLTHGYDETPRDLLPVLAARARAASQPRDRSVASSQIGANQVSYFATAVATVDPVIARYALPGLA